MDISPVFKTHVKTFSSCNKIIETPNDANICLKSRLKHSPFSLKAQKITNQVTKLHRLLLECRPAYLNFHNFSSSAPQMTDSDRDEMDSVAQDVIVTSSKMVNELKKDAEIYEASDISQQNQEHRQIMVMLIGNYLKYVCKIYSELKSMRVKEAIEFRKSSKLISTLKQEKTIPLNDRSNLNIVTSENNVDARDGMSLKVQEMNGDISGISDSEEDNLSPENIQMLEDENKQLYNELNTITEEIKQIESKVVHIAELQEIFTEKVMDQDKNLEHVSTVVVGSTENVKEANEKIRKAIQRNAGLRVWILFAIIVLSFTLLFLDWYND